MAPHDSPVAGDALRSSEAGSRRASTASAYTTGCESTRGPLRMSAGHAVLAAMNKSLARGVGSDHRHLTAHQIGCEIGQSAVLVLCPAILNRHILALDVAGFTKALAECGQKAGINRPRAVEESYHRHRRLLRARRRWPRRRRAADERYELTPLHFRGHSMTSSARPSSGSGTVSPSALAVFRLMISANFVSCWTGRSAGFSPLRMRPV